MTDRVAEIRRFSDRDAAVLFRRGFMLSQAGSTEIAVVSDPNKMFIPQASDESYLKKQAIVRSYNREFRSDVESKTMGVF